MIRMPSEGEGLVEQRFMQNPWKLLIDNVTPGQIDVMRLEKMLAVLIQHGKIHRPQAAVMRYTHRFCCQCCGEEVTMATAFKRPPKLCGDCEESNALAGWCRFCDGIAEELSIEQWRVLPVTEQQRLRHIRQDEFYERK